MPKSKISPEYLPPVIVNSAADCYLEWYENGRRRRVRLNKYKNKFTKKEFNAVVAGMVEEITARNTKINFSDDELLQALLDKWIGEKRKELRRDTLRSYMSFASMFGEWCRRNRLMYLGEVDVRQAARYLDYIYNERDVSTVTRNNQMKLGRAFFSWIIENGLIDKSPFAVCKKKREPDKKRVLIPAEDRARIIAHLQDSDPAFLCVCRLVYSSLIRPKEIWMIRIRDINLKRHSIEIPATNAKNHNTRYATLSPDIEAYILTVIKRKPGDYYLFGKGMVPDASPCGIALFRHKWMKLREDLNLPLTYQLYSLRDTGIVDLLSAGVDPLAVMHHADHHDLSITTRYADHADPALVQKIYNKTKF